MTCSCSTRSTSPASSGHVAISSRKMVPPWAASNLPRRSATAPVKARAHGRTARSRSAPRDGRAVDLDERSRAPPAQGVDVARHELLARTVLAEDQHAPVGGAAIATCSRRCSWRSSRRPSYAAHPPSRAAPDSPPRADAGAWRCAPRAPSSRARAASRRVERPILIARTADSMCRGRKCNYLDVDLPLAHSRQRGEPSMPGSQISRSTTS